MVLSRAPSRMTLSQYMFGTSKTWLELVIWNIALWKKWLNPTKSGWKKNHCGLYSGQERWQDERKEEKSSEGHELQANAHVPLLSSLSPSGRPAPLWAHLAHS